MTDLVYALVQVVHNLGAVAVVGGPAAALVCRPQGAALERRLALVLLFAWALQGATGAGFALVSWELKGQLPEVTGIALAALAIKVAATAAGCALAALLVRRGIRWSPRGRRAAWAVSLGLAASALTAAAFLRWYL